MGKMKVKACIHCKKLFESNDDQEVCPVCNAIIEKKFIGVRRYVRENEQAGLEIVSKECQVSVKQLLRWVREERLIFSEKSDVGVGCLSCGVTIRAGKYCVGCKRKMITDLSSVRAVVKTEDEAALTLKSARMHLAHYSG